MEQYLRIFSNHPQDNWVELLPMAQFAYNSSKSSTTGKTPFYANYGYEPTAYRETAPTTNGIQGINEKASRKVEELRSLHDKLREKIAQGNEKMAQQANKKRIEGPILREGDKVYLLTKNLPTLRPSKKLNAIRIGPFEVKKRIKEVNYELRLPRNMRIRPVFHISLLEPAPADAPLETDIEMEPDQTDYEVEQILDVRKFGKQWRYLVRWKNYPPEEDSWEPLKCLNCPQRQREFHQRHPAKFDPRSQGSKASQANRRVTSRGRRPGEDCRKEQVARIRSMKMQSPDSLQPPDTRALPNLQSTKSREPRIPPRDVPGSEVAFSAESLQQKPYVRLHGGDPPLDETPQGESVPLHEGDPALDGTLRFWHEEDRDSSRAAPTSSPRQRGRNECRAGRTQNRTQKRERCDKSASLSCNKSKAVSPRCLKQRCGPRGPRDDQHDSDFCPSAWRHERKGKTNNLAPTWRSSSSYTAYTDQGAAEPQASASGRSRGGGGRVLRAASQIALHRPTTSNAAEPQ